MKFSVCGKELEEGGRTEPGKKTYKLSRKDENHKTISRNTPGPGWPVLEAAACCVRRCATQNNNSKKQ